MVKSNHTVERCRYVVYGNTELAKSCRRCAAIGSHDGGTTPKVPHQFSVFVNNLSASFYSMREISESFQHCSERNYKYYDKK